MALKTISYDPDRVHRQTDENMKCCVGKYGYFGEDESELITQFIESCPFQKCDKLAKVDEKTFFESNGYIYSYFYELEDDYVLGHKHKKVYSKLFEKFNNIGLDNSDLWAGMLSSAIENTETIIDSMIKNNLEDEAGYEKTNGDKF